MRYIFDTSAVIVLLEICDLEHQLLNFSEANDLLIPQRVEEEYLRGARRDKNVLRKLFRVIDVALERNLLPYFNFDSGSGEIWVISHAINHRDCRCVIDEEFGRNICKLFGVNLTGAIGIVKAMRGEGLLSAEEIAAIKQKIENSRFYLSKKLLDELNE